MLDMKRDGTAKCRGCKRGYEENLAEADGPEFNYYAHVAELKAVRAAVLRPNRRERLLAIKDVRTAFLQSLPYPDGKVKHVKFYDPVTKKWRYFVQSGPIYGENSAPAHWGEGTLAPYLIDEQGCNFKRGDNHKSVYYNKQKDLLMLTYVDDLMLDGHKSPVIWCDKKIDSRFDCKPLEILVAGSSIDFIGMEVIMTIDRIYISMEAYIEKMVRELTEMGLVLCKREVSMPLTGPINVDGDSPSLSPKDTRLLLTGNGCCAWLSQTVRVDGSHSFSRVGQHASNPTVDALDALTHMVSYFYQHKDLCLSQPLYIEDVDHSINMSPDIEGQLGFHFYCDTDHASNHETQNKMRSQNGFVFMIGEGCFDWCSKASSIAFATPLIGEAHADTNTGAVETYGTANTTHDLLNTCYLYQEAGMEFPLPFTLLTDNTTAEAFCKETVRRSKLCKHRR